MAYETPLVRQWTLLRILCARHYGATVRDMAEEMGVSEKTIRRDLDTFERVGFPLTETLRITAARSTASTTGRTNRA